MFRCKKGTLLKRLWQHRLDAGPDTERLKAAAFAMLAALDEHHLKTLLDALETRAGEWSPCVVHGPTARTVDGICAYALSCRLWRWPQLGDELKCLVWCHARDLCINPYHWSKLCKSDSLECVPTSEDRLWSEPGCWAEMAYWEFKERVGRLFPVHDNFINVFADLPRGNGFCLKSMSAVSNKHDSVTTKIKNKIGLGITISREDNSVWVYNRSNYPVFLNSHTLDPPTARKLTVYKLLPGYSIKAFDYDKAAKYSPLQEKIQSEEGPFDPYTIRISFTKGWGPKYSRQCITNCPCWLELILVRR
ncbi:mothers against decapentaplegic 6-like protein [Dinothrombium tinctorium]|uniref:Mothers against decapentaplegic homolog n=1 Tax=Dinothrombium tinctorium TaxID=1965070 RepID=A0A443RNH5_9ACAR|nr:mothers against decapentaplegic 6-like protein [Dinothrombium tinctorium]